MADNVNKKRGNGGFWMCPCIIGCDCLGQESRKPFPCGRKTLDVLDIGDIKKKASKILKKDKKERHVELGLRALNSKERSFEKAPKSKFIIVGVVNFLHKILLHKGCNNLSYAKKYVQDLKTGKRVIESKNIKSFEDLQSVIIIDDRGHWRKIYGNLMSSLY